MTNIESISTEETVKRYIKPFVVQEFLKSNINEQRDSKLRQYAKLAGFRTEVLNQLNDQKAIAVLHSAMKKLNLSIVIKRPPFPSNASELPREIDLAQWRFNPYLGFRIIKIDDKVTTSSVQKKTFFVFGKTKTVQLIKREARYLLEVEPSEYIGGVPLNAIEVAGKAVETNLVPRLWVAGTVQELHNSVRLQVDPLLVGYPVVGENEEGNKQFQTTYCLLLAAWGKDLELMDKYFSSK